MSNDDYLPVAGKRTGAMRDKALMTWIDMPVLLMPEGLDPTKLHCPGDIHRPGSVKY